MSVRAAILASLLVSGVADVAHADLRLESPPASSSTRIVHDPDAWARRTQHVARLLDVRTTRLTRPRSASVTVSATRLDRSAGLVVQPGDVVQVVEGKGGWTVDRRSFALVGIAGHVTESALHKDWGHMRAIDTLPFGRLLVRVGDGPWLDAGSGALVQTFVGGALQFSINDNGGSFADNDGAIEIQVTIAGGPPMQTAPPPMPAESPTPGCSDTLCGPGQRCILKQVQCIAAPCPPQPMCIGR